VKKMLLKDVLKKDKKSPRVRIAVFKKLVDSILNYDCASDMRKWFDQLRSTQGEYCLFYSLIRDVKFWQDVRSDKGVLLDYLMTYVKRNQFYIPSYMREKAIRLAVELAEKYAQSHIDNIFGYLYGVISPILWHTSCYNLTIEPSFYSEMVKRIVKVLPPKGMTISVNDVKRNVIGVLLKDLAQLGYYDLDLAELAASSVGRRELFIAMRRNAYFYPVLQEYLKQVSEEDFRYFVELYLDAIGETIHDFGSEMEYRYFVDMLPAVTACLPQDEGVKLDIICFLRRVAETDNVAIRGLVCRKLPEKPNQVLLSCLTVALACSNVDYLEKLIDNIVSCPSLRDISSNTIHDIMYSFYLSSYHRLRRACCIANKLVQYKEFFRDMLLRHNYNILLTGGNQLYVLLFFVAVLDSYAAWKQFVEENINMDGRTVADILNENHLEDLFTCMLVHYFNLNNALELSMYGTAKHMRGVFDSLIELGVNRSAARTALYRAVDNLRFHRNIEGISLIIDNDLISDFKTEMRNFGLFRVRKQSLV